MCYCLPRGDGTDIDAETFDQLLQPLEGKRLDCTALARANQRAPGEDSVCHFLRCRAGTVILPENIVDKRGVGAAATAESVECVVVELVADRFLRQLVRVLVATVAREAAKALQLQGNCGRTGQPSPVVVACDKHAVLRLLLNEDGTQAAAASTTVHPSSPGDIHAPITNVLSVVELRAATAPPAPATGLCLASVGYVPT